MAIEIRGNLYDEPIAERLTDASNPDAGGIGQPVRMLENELCGVGRRTMILLKGYEYKIPHATAEVWKGRGICEYLSDEEWNGFFEEAKAREREGEEAQAKNRMIEGKMKEILRRQAVAELKKEKKL